MPTTYNHHSNEQVRERHRDQVLQMLTDAERLRIISHADPNAVEANVDPAAERQRALDALAAFKPSKDEKRQLNDALAEVRTAVERKLEEGHIQVSATHLYRGRPDQDAIDRAGTVLERAREAIASEEAIEA